METERGAKKKQTRGNKDKKPDETKKKEEKQKKGEEDHRNKHRCSAIVITTSCHLPPTAATL
jgi:hypothetical protein